MKKRKRDGEKDGDRYIERESKSRRERERENEIESIDDGTQSRLKMTDKDASFREDLKFLTPTEYGNQRVG